MLYKLQVAKIVGAASAFEWAQVHAFFPSQKDKKEKWGDLVAVLALRAKEKDLEIASFGKETIQRFHEFYYSSQEENILTRLKQTLEKVKSEFGQQVVLQFAGAVLIDGEKPTVYLVADGAAVKIYRANQLATIVKAQEQVKTASGYLQDKDILILGTSQFFAQVPSGVVKAALQKQDLEAIKEELAALVGGRAENSQTAVAVITFEKKPQVERNLPLVSQRERKIMSKLGFSSQKFFRFFGKSQELFSRLWEDLFLKREGKIPYGKKTNLTIAFILIFLLVASIILGFRKKTLSGRKEMQNQVLVQADAHYKQALEMASLQPARAKSLLEEAGQELEAYRQKEGLDEQINQLVAKINLALQDISREYTLHEGKVFLDLELIKEGFSGLGFGLAFPRVAVLDGQTGIIIAVDLTSKQGQILAADDEFKESRLLAKTPGFTFVVGKKKLFMIKDEDGSVMAEKAIEDLGVIRDIVGFAGNVYLLGEKQIFKFVGLDEGLSDKMDWTEKETDSLGGGVSLAIDGSVWLLTLGGQILKFTQGLPDYFVFSRLDKPFAQPEVVFTTPECDHLYILDKKNTRVVVVGKNGEYQASYFWLGIAGVSDLVVSEEEGKIFLLAGSRIYEIELR